MAMKYCSIIMCHYSKRDDFSDVSRSESMKKSVESLIENTDYPVEFIVVDNGGAPDDSDYFLDLSRKKKISTYIRNSDNTSFGYAWNQAFRVATGDYVGFTCNDILFKKGWLSATIAGLENHTDRKLIATPYITPDKDRPNWNKEVLDDGYRINSLAGSNCMFMKPSDFLEIGQIPQHRIGGSIWHRIMVSKGYMVIAPPIDMVSHIEYRNGVDWKKAIKVEKTLLDNSKIDFHYANYHKRLFHGTQKDAGVPLL